MAELRQRKTELAEKSSVKEERKETEKPADGPLLVDSVDKWQKWRTRFFSGSIMIAGFFLILSLGHLALVAFIFAIQVATYSEIMTIAQEKLKNSKKADGESVLISRFLSWFYFFCTTYFVIGKIFLRFEDFFLNYSPVTAFLAKNHTFISFALYTLGFVGFVFSLKKGLYKKQFVQLAWTFVTLLFVVIQASFHIINIFEGLFWFFLPVALIACNDIWAYIVGFFIGKTPLISLSPKKTWEGFLGATIATWFFGFLFAYVSSQSSFLYCPRTELLSFTATCTPNPVFVQKYYDLPEFVVSLFSQLGIDKTAVLLYPAQLHVLNLATFASLIAPFGGFFASGFKRAFKIKDFGDSIPGHGGITDRMDCQIVMGMFSFVYISQFVKTAPTGVESILHNLWLLDDQSQLEVFDRLKAALSQKQIL
eukprot:TRINITY_DN469_c0_g3_i3.p1 TRINITY_DN469_c0_g3~~TRINITY_DN469_c0_g3_i3.p1  ORF type:complete len:435 (-),score=87.71 TRINITY_DN469_c0_g3_i3:218-1486(-)